MKPLGLRAYTVWALSLGASDFIGAVAVSDYFIGIDLKLGV
jgi:hypothetical protein